MGKKRKAAGVKPSNLEPKETKYDIEERFDDSEDDFYAGRDKVLLDEEPATKRRRLEEQEKYLQLSDEEVLEHDGTDDDFDDAQSLEESASEEEENWGTSKADYYSADTIETEADALDEENEARRLQQKQLKNMTHADFGFDELAWAQPDTKSTTSKPIVEKLPDAKIPEGAGNEVMTSILHSRYPEFSLLAKDLVQLQDTWQMLHNGIANKTGREGITLRTKLNALTSYLGSIAMYFAVVTSNTGSTNDTFTITAIPPNELREHAVIDSLMTSKSLWDHVKDIEELEVLSEPTPVNITPKNVQMVEKRVNGKKETKSKQMVRQPSSDSEEFEELPQLPKKVKKSKIDLQSLLAQSATPQEEISEFGDEEPLTEQQAAEKARKKKSLRFYTSQIAQKANKRGAASRDAGGDDDVPHKERLRDKQERLLREAEKRGQQKATAEEELDDSGEEDVAVDDGYYESLVTSSKKKKADKQARADAFAEAAKQGAQVYEEEQVGADEKRKITYAIEKNKGLTPKRKKDVRNPRVKKRKKFDEKMKKLGSMRQVYKGGEGRGGYKGELTGIKTNVVKSIKL